MRDPMQTILRNEKNEKEFFRMMGIQPEKFALAGTATTAANSSPAPAPSMSSSVSSERKRKRLRKKIGAEVSRPATRTTSTRAPSSRPRPGTQSGFAPAVRRSVPRYERD